jgi:hypothetical protein
MQTTLELYALVTPKMRANTVARVGSLVSRARTAADLSVASSE